MTRVDYCTVFFVFKIQADGGIEVPVPEVLEWLTKHVQFGAHYKRKTIPSKVAARHSRGPIFFKIVRVDYDKDQGRLKLSEGEFPGREVMSGVREAEQKEEDAEEYAESIVGSGEEESYLTGKENDQSYIVCDNFYPTLEMVDSCHFNLSLVSMQNNGVLHARFQV